MRPIVLTIAGSDSSAGAGVQADLKAIEACGGYAATAITAITAQNTRGVVRAEPLPADLVTDQIDAVFDDLDVAAVKTGMLADAAIVDAVAEALARRRPRFVVCDPVMVSKTGYRLLDDEAAGRIASRLFPLATVVTPNVPELERLSGLRVRDLEDARRAAQRLIAAGAQAVLVTGGHLDGAPGTDLLVGAGGGERMLEGAWIDSPHTHGTGCTFASALAARLACGEPLASAAASAKRFVVEAIRHGLALGGGVGPPDPLYRLHRPGGRPDGGTGR